MVQVVMEDIEAAFREYTGYAMLSGIIFVMIIMIFWLLAVNLSRPQARIRIPYWILLYYIFYVYGFLVVSITLLSRPPGSREGVSLKLLGTLTHNIYGDRYLVENVILFIPLGFMLPLLWKGFYIVYRSIGIGLLCSISIEICQHITRRGYLQLDDIVLNVFGTIIGYLGIYILHKLKGFFMER